MPRSQILEILERIANINERYPLLKVANFGHVGDGNIHVNVMYKDGTSQRVMAEGMIDEILHATVELGGTISGNTASET